MTTDAESGRLIQNPTAVDNIMFNVCAKIADHIAYSLDGYKGCMRKGYGYVAQDYLGEAKGQAIAYFVAQGQVGPYPEASALIEWLLSDWNERILFHE